MKYTNGNGSLEPLTILDSKHIVATILYDIKLVKCGEYTQVYLYQNKKMIKKSKKLKPELDLILDIDKENVTKKERYLNNKIENRSIIRSKLDCQRIAKSNISEWESFITLTFKENIINLDYANKRLKNFIDKIRRVKKGFKYLCIPEFQERGAVHYHLLTNLKCNSDIIPKREVKKLYSPFTNRYKKLEYYDIKYWFEGFSSAEPITGDVKKIIGYISKYMTKDIDNRLFNRHRYFYSKNLKTSEELYINKDNTRDFDLYKKIIQDSSLIYHNTYINPYDNTEVKFLEYLNK